MNLKIKQATIVNPQDMIKIEQPKPDKIDAIRLSRSDIGI